MKPANPCKGIITFGLGLVGSLVASFSSLAQPGSVDPGFAPSLNLTGTVYSLAVQPDQKVILGGSFSSAQGAGIARLNPDGSLDASFVPGRGAEFGKVTSIAVQQDGRIFIGGDFRSVSGIDRQCLARLQSNGQLDPSFVPEVRSNGIASTVSSFILQKDEKLIVGFDAREGHDVALGRFMPDGHLDKTFPNLTVLVVDVVVTYPMHVQKLAAVPNDQFYVHLFYWDGREFAESWSRRHPNGEGDPFVLPSSGISNVTCVAVQPDGKLLLGGHSTGSGAPALRRFNTDGSPDSFPVNLTGTPTALLVQSDGKIMVAGVKTVNGIARTGIARLNANGSLDTTFDPGIGPGTNHAVLAIAFANDCGIVAGGTFNEFGGLPRRGVAKVLGDPAGPPSIAQHPISRTNAIGQEVSFSVLSSCASDLSYHWLFNGEPIPNETNAVLTLPEVTAAHAGDYQVVLSNESGTLTSDAGHLTLVAAPQLPGSVDISFRPDRAPNRAVQALVKQADGKIIVGGIFTRVGEEERQCIARLEPDGRLDPSFQPSTFENNGLLPSVNAIAVQTNGKVLLGGSFTAINARLQSGIARLNADGTFDDTFAVGPGVTGTTTSVVQFLKIQPDGKIVLGGVFRFVNGNVRTNIARLNSDGSFDSTFDASLCCSTTVKALELDQEGRILVAIPPAQLLRLRANGTIDLSIFTGVDGNAVQIGVQRDGMLVLGSREWLRRFHPTGGFHSELSIPGMLSLHGMAVDSFDMIYLATSIGFRTLFRVAPYPVNRLDDPFMRRLVVDGAIYAMLMDSDGTMLVAGTFAHVNGVRRNYIARLNWGVRLLNPQYDATGFTADIDTEQSRRYTLEYFSNSAWTSIATNYGTGTRQTLRDPTTQGQQRIYRVQTSY